MNTFIRFASFLVFVFYSCITNAQTDLETAKDQLAQLKHSFLLVRLQTSEKKIQAMKDKGYAEKAETTRQEQYQENKEIILSFDQTFTFCPVYFFYSEASEDIRQGKLEGNVFNSNKEVVDADKLKQRPFFTAEFSETRKLGIDALVLMDGNMVPLEAPFPFYERKYTFFSLIKRSKPKIVEKYNDRLHLQYKQWFKE